MIDQEALAAPFPPECVSFRVGSTTKDKSKGMALAYVSARDVMDRLDEVCGPGGWQCRYLPDGARMACEIGIRVGDEWIWKSDGAGATDVEGEKGIYSDSFKRAAVMWGIARYLYRLGNRWVALEQRGGTHIIPDAEMQKLRATLPRPVKRATLEVHGPAAAAINASAVQQTPGMHATARDIHLGHIADAETIADLKAWQDEHAARASSLPEEFFAPVHAALVCRGFELARTDKEFLAWRDSSRKGLERLPRGLKNKTLEAYEAALLRFKEAVGAAA
jgi:hypothetical protein